MLEYGESKALCDEIDCNTLVKSSEEGVMVGGIIVGKEKFETFILEAGAVVSAVLSSDELRASVFTSERVVLTSVDITPVALKVLERLPTVRLECLGLEVVLLGHVVLLLRILTVCGTFNVIRVFFTEGIVDGPYTTLENEANEVKKLVRWEIERKKLKYEDGSLSLLTMNVDAVSIVVFPSLLVIDL